MKTPNYTIFQKIKYYEWKVINMRSELKKIEQRLERLRHDALIVPLKSADKKDEIKSE